MSIRILILALSLIPFNSGFALTKNGIVKKTPFITEKYSWPTWNETIVFDNMKASEKKRKPANTIQLDESMMSNELRAVQAKLFNIKTSEEMEKFLAELDSGYDSAPSDVKFYTSQLLPTRAFRGIFYRLRSLFEGKSNFIHSQILTIAKKLATKNQVYLPADHTQAGFDYISAPYLKQNGNVIEGIKSEAELQIWMVGELLPEIKKSIQRLEKLPLVEPILWDQKMIFGNQSFSDGINRFKMIGEFEKNLLLSASYASIASMATIRAYNVEKSISLSKDIGFLYGFDGFGVFKDIEGVSAEKIAKVFKNKTYATIGTLMPDGKPWMAYAYKSSLRSLKIFSLAWNLSADERKEENLYLVNTGFINVNREKIAENLQLLNRVISSQGAESLRSAVTGEVIQVNYSKIFLDPPSDLKVFLPTDFDHRSKISRKIATSNGGEKSLTYRNYAEGSPKKWNLNHYKNYFPSTETNDDIFRITRVISHVQGNWLMIK